MRSGLFLHASLILAALATACGTSSPDGTGGAASSPFLSWNDNDNGDVVLDADGDAFVFDRSSGCAYEKASMVGPEGFCLTPSGVSPSGYAAYGSTGCSGCTPPSFSVVLTKDPASSGCIAVLGDGSATVTVGLQSLALTETGGGFSIGTTASPTAYAVYWNGVIPRCDDTNPFAGSYTGTITGYTCPAGYTDDPTNPATCNGANLVTKQATTAAAGSLAFTIDSAGQIDEETDKIQGIVSSNGVGTVISVGAGCGQACTEYTVGAAAQNGSGKWVLSGAGTLVESALDANAYTFSVTQQ